MVKTWAFDNMNYEWIIHPETSEMHMKSCQKFNISSINKFDSSGYKFLNMINIKLHLVGIF
jgi:hypothetical protein